MNVCSVFGPAFKSYGRVVTGLDAEKQSILAALRTTPLPDGVGYVPEEPLLQSLPAAQAVQDHLFGGMPCQLGWCNGHNTRLNCLEYHRDSEFNLGTEDFILLLARLDEVENGRLDTAKVRAFRVPAGVLVALPKGTNTAKPALPPAGGEDALLWARNKWLLAHPDSAEAAQGAFVGLLGRNIDLAEE